MCVCSLVKTYQIVHLRFLLFLHIQLPNVTGKNLNSSQQICFPQQHGTALSFFILGQRKIGAKSLVVRGISCKHKEEDQMVSEDKWNWKYMHGIHFLIHRCMRFLYMQSAQASLTQALWLLVQSVGLHEPRIVDGVTPPTVSLTPLAPTPFSFSSSAGFPNSTQCLAVDLHICVHYLLDVASWMTIGPGNFREIQKIKGESQSRFPRWQLLVLEDVIR